MKTTIIALSAAALIAAAPAVLAQNASSRTPDQHHKVFKKRLQVVTGSKPQHFLYLADPMSLMILTAVS